MRNATSPCLVNTKMSQRWGLTFPTDFFPVSFNCNQRFLFLFILINLLTITYNEMDRALELEKTYFNLNLFENVVSQHIFKNT